MPTSSSARRTAQERNPGRIILHSWAPRPDIEPLSSLVDSVDCVLPPTQQCDDRSLPNIPNRPRSADHKSHRENRELITCPRISPIPFSRTETRITTLPLHHLSHMQGCPLASEPKPSVIKLSGLLTHGSPCVVSLTLAIPIDPKCTRIILIPNSCGSATDPRIVLSWSVRTMVRRSPFGNLPPLA